MAGLVILRMAQLADSVFNTRGCLMIALQSSRQTLLRVESERLSQRTTLHLALGGSFAQPVTTPPAAGDSAGLQ